MNLKYKITCFSFLSENTLLSINDSFQIYRRFFGWIIQLFKVLDWTQTIHPYLPLIGKPMINYEALIQTFIGSEYLSK